MSSERGGSWFNRGGGGSSDNGRKGRQGFQGRDQSPASAQHMEDPNPGCADVGCASAPRCSAVCPTSEAHVEAVGVQRRSCGGSHRVEAGSGVRMVPGLEEELQEGEEETGCGVQGQEELEVVGEEPRRSRRQAVGGVVVRARDRPEGVLLHPTFCYEAQALPCCEAPLVCGRGPRV